MALVLASRSPQRSRILADLGVPFVPRPVDVLEEEEGAPVAVAGENALRKALAAGAEGDEITLGVDTIVVLGLEIYGKPPTAAAARSTLERLSGQTHEVISAVALLRADGSVDATQERTTVTFRALDDAMLDWYVASGEWDGRAGGYAIQGRGGALVERIEGDYLNVVGLPVGALLGLLPDLLKGAA